MNDEYLKKDAEAAIDAETYEKSLRGIERNKV